MVRRLVPYEQLLKVLIKALSARKLRQVLQRRRSQPVLTNGALPFAPR